MKVKHSYDRSVKMFDEAHSPVTIDNMLKSGKINSKKFLSAAHAQSYLLQMQTIAKLQDVKSVFEIGPGEHYCANNLRRVGFKYVTFDFETAHSPDIVGDWNYFNVNKHNERYDICCAFQVLEHFPWAKFHVNLLKLAMLSNKYVFISIPYSCVGFTISSIVHKGQGKTEVNSSSEYFPTNLPQRKYREEYVAEFPWAVHYWEAGREGISLDTVFEVFKECNLEIIDKFHSPNPYHYFILARKV